MKNITVDGVSLEMDDTAAAVVQRAMQSLTDQIASGKQASTTLETQLAAANTQLATVNTAVQTKDGEIVGLKKNIADGAMTPQKIDQLVRDRMNVVTRATNVLGATFVCDGKTDVEIKRAVCSAKLGDTTIATMTDEAINGAFSALTAGTAAGGPQVLADAFSRPGYHNTGDAAAIAYDKRSKALENAHKPQAA